MPIPVNFCQVTRTPLLYWMWQHKLLPWDRQSQASKNAAENQHFIPALAKLGECWDLKLEVLEKLNNFTCAIYGKNHTSDVDQVRHAHICALGVTSLKKNLDMASLPPCKLSLAQHAKRANCQTAIWKLAHIPRPAMPLPTAGHGWLCETNQIVNQTVT